MNSSNYDCIKFVAIVLSGIVILLIASSGAVATDGIECTEMKFGDEKGSFEDSQIPTSGQQQYFENHKNSVTTVSNGSADTHRYHVPFANNQKELRSSWGSKLRLTAGDTETLIELDRTADGKVDETVTLEPDETITFDEPEPGAVIEASAPISVRYRYGSTNYGAYEDGKQAYGIPSESLLGKEYILPIDANDVWVASSVKTTVRVDTNDDGNFDTTERIPANGSVRIDGVTSGTQISADDPVHVVAEQSNWEEMDNTYALSLLPVEEARTAYDIPAEADYNRENPDSRSGISIAGTENNTTVTTERDGNTVDTISIEQGETKRIETQDAVTLTADNPVVAAYSFHVVATDPWTEDRRDYVGAWTPLPEQKIKQGSWSGTSEHVHGWSTFSVVPRERTDNGDNDDEDSPNGTSVVIDPTTVEGEPGETVTFDLVIENADQGVGAYDVNLTSADPAVTFENISLRNDPTFPVTEVSENGTHLRVEVGMGENQHPAADEIVLAEITAVVDSEATPDKNVTIQSDDAEVADEDVNQYNITTEGATTLSIVDPTAIFEIDPIDDREISSSERSGVSFEATVTNTGDGNETKPVTLQIENETVATENATINVSETATVTFEGVPIDRSPGEYNYTIVTGDDEQSGTLEIVEGVDPVVGDTPPQDPDGDGTFEDIDGDGQITIFDVQILFDNLDNDAVQNNPGAYNFGGQDNPDEVTIFDVQGLFGQI